MACRVGHAEQEFQQTRDMVVSAVTETLRLILDPVVIVQGEPLISDSCAFQPPIVYLNS